MKRLVTFADQLLRLCCIGCVVFLSFSAQAQAGGHAPPYQRLTAGLHVIQAEIASSPSQRQIGLMFRTQLSPNVGMLFIFDEKTQHCMWMRNTLIPLSVAFIDDDGRIINIENMLPQTETLHCARQPVRYALEMELGWFKRRGITPGIKIKGLRPGDA
jgi:uncharacterized membrane protein (UPF0127 family)